jgi:ParB-like chromosome segregation protein Spo0J
MEKEIIMPLPSSLRIAKSDLFKINPMNLELSEEKYNGRWVPVSTEKVRELATSIATQRQKQPVRVRRISGKGEDAVFTVTAGFTCTKAVILINKDKELRELAGLRSHEDIFPLQCIMSNVNDTEAFVENVIENALRHETSPIDDAHNHEKMRTLGFKDADIARTVQIAPIQ